MRVRIDGNDWHLDVESTHPGGVVIAKGTTVRRIIVLRELGLKRREPVWFLSVGLRKDNLKVSGESTKGSICINPWCIYWCKPG